MKFPAPVTLKIAMKIRHSHIKCGMFFGVLFLACAAAALASDREFIQITLPADATPNTVLAIASIGESEKVITGPEDTISKIVGVKCGPVDPVYFRLVKDNNPKLDYSNISELLPAGKNVILPACATRPAAELKNFQRGDTLGKYLPPAVLPSSPIDAKLSASRRQHINNSVTLSIFGSKISIPVAKEIKVLSQISAKTANEIVLSSSEGSVPIVDPNKILAGQSVKIPTQIPLSKTIQLRPGLALDAALSQLKAATAYDEVDVSSVARRGFEAKLPLPLTGDKADCLSTTDLEQWPLPYSMLAASLNDNEAFRTGLDLSVDKSTVLVLDTGFDFRGINPGYPATSFPVVQSMRAKLTQFGGKDEPDFTSEGVNLATLRTGGGTSGPYYVGGRDMRWHGAAVVSAALGSRATGISHIQKIGSVATASTMRNGVPATFSAPEALGNAFKYAYDIGAKVVNYSFEIGSNPQIDTQLSKYGSGFVVVAAAGNSGGWEESWPAKYGGDRGNANGAYVITVGGHEPSGELWKSSNRHSSRVDLLAPSCGVPVYEGKDNGTTKWPVAAVLAGTSLAAPLVSFVASLLAAERLSPAEIKTRLMTSAKIDGRVIDASYSGGILDAPTALTLYRDVVRVRDETGTSIFHGRIGDDAAVISLCGMSSYAGKIQKLVVYSVEGKAKVLSWIKEGDDTVLWKRDCNSSKSDFNLNFESDDGHKFYLSPNKDFDLTRAHFHP